MLCEFFATVNSSRGSDYLPSATVLKTQHRVEPFASIRNYFLGEERKKK